MSCDRQSNLRPERLFLHGLAVASLASSATFLAVASVAAAWIAASVASAGEGARVDATLNKGSLVLRPTSRLRAASGPAH